MPQRITVVDAFTDRPFAGNPAAVCLLREPADEAWMLDVAREMNLSETAFLVPLGAEEGFSLRWFTPTVEVDLCGHATLGSAHILWESGALEPHRAAFFSTRSGRLSATKRGDEIELDFPEMTLSHAPVPDGLGTALGASLVRATTTGMDLLVEVASETLLRAISPDFAGIARLPVRGLIVTSRSDSADFDFVSRFFAPSVGVPEDPVTGSAHCALAPYWGDRLGKTEMVGFQASARGGIVRVRREDGRVKIGGRAVTVLRAELVAG